MLGRVTDKENARATQNQTPPSAGGDQREPTFPAFCFPAPPPLAGKQDATHQPQQRSNRRDALLARQKRGAAVAQPSHSYLKSQERNYPSKQTGAHCLRRVLAQAKGKSLPTLKNERENST